MRAETVRVQWDTDHTRPHVFHECPQIILARPGEVWAGYGPAVIDVYLEDDGEWHIGNGEYATPAAYCPFCGVHLADLADDVRAALGQEG